MAAMYALYHGPQGLRHIAERTHNAALILAEGKHIVIWSLSAESSESHSAKRPWNGGKMLQYLTTTLCSSQVWKEQDTGCIVRCSSTLWRLTAALQPKTSLREPSRGRSTWESTVKEWWEVIWRSLDTLLKPLNRYSYKLVLELEFSVFTHKVKTASINPRLPKMLNKRLMNLFLCRQVGVSLDETVTERDLDDLLWVFGCESSAVSL